MPPWISVTDITSRNSEALDLDVARLERRGRRCSPSNATPTAFTPSQGRAECADAALEDDTRVEVAEAAELEGVVGRLEADDERAPRRRAARRAKTPGSGFSAGPSSSRGKKSTAEVVRELGRRGPVGELDHHGEAALHVARAEADDGAVLDPAGQVRLRRDRVGVAREQRRAVDRCAWRRAATRRRRARTGSRTGTSDVSVTAASERETEGMSTSASVRSARAAPGPAAGIIDRMIPRSAARSPSAGSSSPCWPREWIRTTSSPRSRSSPGRQASSPSAQVVQHRARPAQRTYVGKGKLEELKERFQAVEAESLLVDDELDPAQQRYLENALGHARHRPHPADPRHLRPARGDRRGQAPGRARAARVQPAAHARHVAAPRAPRRRGRHARPGRVAARDRPPARAAAHLGAEEAPPGSRASARDAAQGASPHRDRRRSRSPATRTSASRRS